LIAVPIGPDHLGAVGGQDRAGAAQTRCLLGKPFLRRREHLFAHSTLLRLNRPAGPHGMLLQEWALVKKKAVLF